MPRRRYRSTSTSHKSRSSSKSWKTGYRRVTELARADEDEIPTFIMLRRLLLVAWIGSHSETDLAKSMGVAYSEGTVGLCENYLTKFG